MRTYFKFISLIPIAMIIFLSVSCNQQGAEEKTEFKYQIDRFEDIQILRYQIPDFETLDLRQKTLLYYLLSLENLCGCNLNSPAVKLWIALFYCRGK